jgi:hypothetical protein
MASWALRSTTSPSSRISPAEGVAQPEDGLGDLGPTRADEAVDADDLALADLKLTSSEERHRESPRTSSMFSPTSTRLAGGRGRGCGRSSSA